MISFAQTILSLALALLVSAQSGGANVTDAVRQQAITVATQAIQIAEQALGGQTQTGSSQGVAENSSQSNYSGNGTILSNPTSVSTSATNSVTTSTAQSGNIISITGVKPSSGPVGSQLTITGSGFSKITLAPPGGSNYGEGIWLTNGSVWSYLGASSQAEIVNDNTIVATVGSGACPSEQSACSSAFSSTLTPGNYSLYADAANGSIVSNKIPFTLTSGPTPTSNILSVNVNSNLASGSVVANSAGVKIGSYVINNPATEPVLVSSLTIQEGKYAGMLQNFKVMVNGTQLGATASSVPSGGSTAFSGSAFVVPVGGSVTVDVDADVLSSAQPGSPNTTSLTGCVAAGETSQTTYSCGQVTGQIMTVVTQQTASASTISASQNTNVISGSAVAGSAAAQIGSYILTNPASEPVAISVMAIQPGSNANLFQNLAVYVNGVQFGATQSTLTNGALYNISGTPIAIPPQGTLTVNIKADVSASGQSGSTDATTFAGCSATGQNTNTFYSCSPATGQTMTVVTQAH